MKKLPLTKRHRFLRDLAEHYHYIAVDSERSANRFVDDVGRATDLIASVPTVGTAWNSPDARLPEIRSTTVSRRFRNWLIFYRANDQAVELLRILHGARDLKSALPELLADPDGSDA